jgi:hypothetical protein
MMLALLIAACGLAAADTPQLLFTKSELPAVQAQTREPNCAKVWAEILARANAITDKSLPDYVSPDKVDAPPKGEVRVEILGHLLGRPLTQWFETLGFAYQITGDERYGRHGVALLVEAARRLPVTDPRIDKGFAGAKGDIMRAFALGYDWLGEMMTPEERRIVENTCAGYVRRILADAENPRSWWVPHHNFMGVAVGAAGLLALDLQQAFPEEAPGWLEKCTAITSRWFDEGFDEQGAYYEGTGYGLYGLSNGTLFCAALKHCGGPDLLNHPRIRRVPEFYAQSLLPGESIFEARNDANYDAIGDPAMRYIAGDLDNGLAQWLWETCGSSGSPVRILFEKGPAPAPVSPVAAKLPLAEHFVGRGLCVFRTGWSKDDVMYSIEAGPYYRTTHNQGDKGHFGFYGLGHRWAIDSGYGNNQIPDGRAQTAAHNCVMIDGKGQAISGAGAGTNGTIDAFEDSATAGYALANCTEAYNRNVGGQPGAGARRALRHSLFVRPFDGAPAYVLVLDDLQKDDAEHDYTWMMHTAPQNTVALQPWGAVVAQEPDANQYVWTPVDATERGECSWDVNLAEPGEYVLWAKVRATGPELAKTDSFLVQIDGGRITQWHTGATGAWKWGKVASGVEGSPVSFSLSAGRHTVKFMTRESGAQLSRVLVTKDVAAEPPFTAETKGLWLETTEAAVKAPMEVVKTEPLPKSTMRLYLHASVPISFTTDAYEDHLRIKGLARTVAPAFAALLVALPPQMAAPEVSFADAADASTLTVRWPTHTDRIQWPRQGTEVGRPVLSR